jgi:AraC-like DNA-binding protein
MQFWRPLPWKFMDVVCGEGLMPSTPSLHVHEALQLILPVSPLQVTAGTETNVVSTDAIHFTNPLEACSVRGVEDGGRAARVILIGSALLSKVGEHRAAPAGVVRDAQLSAACSTLFEELQRPAISLDCMPRLVACIRELLNGHAAQMRAVEIPERVLRARDYLRVHAVERVALDDLAKVAFLSKFHLLRSFHHALGLTPHEYQMQLRLARARRLLVEGSSLARVTYDSGFADQSHLTRRFTAFYGLTPARFARQVAAPFVRRPPLRTNDDDWSAAPAA